MSDAHPFIGQPAMPPRRALLRSGLVLGLGAAWQGVQANTDSGDSKAGAERPNALPSSLVPPAVQSLIGSPLQQARLAGEGRLRWYGLQVYDARLFVPAEGIDPTSYARFPFALELKYARKLAGDDIAQASIREITRMNLGSDSQRAAWLNAMRSLFPDVQPGERLTGVNQTDGRVLFLRNDARLGRVDDTGFGEAFFAIWLDPRTVAPDLRRALLQQAGSRRS